MVRLLYETLIRLPFTMSDFDTEETKAVRHWKFDFDLRGLDESLVLYTWRQRVIDKTAELIGASSLAIRRIYCNNVTYGDHQHMHFDNHEGTTALYFANAEWPENWQGETIFYDRSGEAMVAVAPKPGRLVVFAAECLHRGGVPAKICLEPRLTVAFKFAA